MPGNGVIVGPDMGTQSMPDSLMILVVEDDQMIQSLIEEVLSDGGFESSIAASGEEAVTLLRGNGNHFRALVTDINLLGKMDGWEVARQAREINPAFPIVYMTGAAADQWASQGVPNSVLLIKPFAPTQLVTAVAQLLNAGSPPIAPA
jgi:CheY-like chemotaxis protein